MMQSAKCTDSHMSLFAGNVKLNGGPTRCEGRVEYFDNNQWGTICSEAWDLNDASVVCKQLDCGKAHTIVRHSEYGLGDGHTWADHIECSGMESTLAQCTHRPFTDTTCNSTAIAGVICTGQRITHINKTHTFLYHLPQNYFSFTGSLEVRLVNSKDDCSGRVEVRHGEVWHTVCDQDWNLSKAQVVCDNLQCGTAVDAPVKAHFGQGSGLVVEGSDSCFKNTTALEQCSLKGFRTSSCGHEQDAGAICAGIVSIGGQSLSLASSQRYIVVELKSLPL